MKKNILMGNGEFNNYYSEKEYSYENNNIRHMISSSKYQKEIPEQDSPDGNKPDTNGGNKIVPLLETFYNRRRLFLCVKNYKYLNK